MKKELVYLLLANISVLTIVLYTTFDLLTLAVDDTFKDAFTDHELNPEHYNTNTDTSNVNSTALNKPQLIPKIIHQTYKTEEIPEHWKEGQQRCIDLHPDYEYILWTDEMALQFIKNEYPWFLETFKSYKYPIERADAIRYFVLVHYGGVYIDLDDGCNRRLDPLLTAPAFVRKTSPTGVSNDVMGSVPRHPFFLKVLNSLKKYNRNWFVPYITIMSSTGPLFISIIWKQYKRSVNYDANENNIVKIIQPADYKGHTYSFFKISKGSSWHLDDAVFVKSLASHILACVAAGFIFAFGVLYCEYLFYCWLCSRSNSQKDLENGPGSNSGSGSSPSSRFFLVRWFRKFCNLISDHFQQSGLISKDDDYHKIINKNTNVELEESPKKQSPQKKITSTKPTTNNVANSNINDPNLKKYKRLRKDSNLPYLNLLADLEKNHPELTDLSK
ncbi:hypothetical protein Kpol_457p1 [Vanderwaltozyma polyspora DSM 70294]|uniref:inositol phosphorylceramide mannosyltransferase n=1 Tax=Vanderwaltozyma polyspora (strain ATCC 22028 / DSM 70294 / BCRC 21397 / CBS 2163 / NBRC 10782 / NRRL Y-8283 / UCD 57-17) TaxID=436907 RepID=A7TQU2_VANPO|nr:uncharacterized protein Kpol_457p1 [Vanderwaltozyma polyspora DSM 70294]EDO15350.1 hypothetical protein Kpol_457p1 [Vanderwaltozyma polyspora DSM 70294]